MDRWNSSLNKPNKRGFYAVEWSYGDNGIEQDKEWIGRSSPTQKLPKRIKNKRKYYKFRDKRITPHITSSAVTPFINYQSNTFVTATKFKSNRTRKARLASNRHRGLAGRNIAVSQGYPISGGTGHPSQVKSRGQKKFSNQIEAYDHKKAQARFKSSKKRKYAKSRRSKSFVYFNGKDFQPITRYGIIKNVTKWREISRREELEISKHFN